MAKYNTFVVQRTNSGQAVLVTSSARKAKKALSVGFRVEVWSANEKQETIYTRTAKRLEKYITTEREYIRTKQAKAEARNKARRARYDRQL
jgi:hypothetical protein